MSFRIGFLCSGDLGLNTLKKIQEEVSPQFIFTDKNSEGIIEFAENNSIPLFVGNPRKKNTYDFLKQFQTDLIFSINYLFIIERDLLAHPFCAINLHGSLLPKYRGRTPHIWAIINGETETGITAHKMEEGCDTGNIFLQRKIPINWNETGADILMKFRKIYPEIVLEVISRFGENDLKQVFQDESKATYFWKRTPEDGKICWDWHKERIFNWVRAQANPYPGAFSYLEEKKIIIDEIEFSDHGFDCRIPNGTIIEKYPHVLVKTPNGIVSLSSIRNQEMVQFLEVGKKFD